MDAAADAGADSGSTFTMVHKSEVIKMTLNPAWKPVDVQLDPTKPLYFKVYDWDRIVSHLKGHPSLHSISLIGPPSPHSIYIYIYIYK